MKKSEQYEMALLAEKALEKAHQKYDDVLSELKQNEDYKETNLQISVEDSIRNLSRKVEAYLHERITMNKLLDEFVFEYDIIDGEMEIEKEASPKIKRLAKRLLSSYEDFIVQVGGRIGLKKLYSPTQRSLKEKHIYFGWSDFLEYWDSIDFIWDEPEPV